MAMAAVDERLTFFLLTEGSLDIFSVTEEMT